MAALTSEKMRGGLAVIPRLPDLPDNHGTDTDVYKFGHFRYYPEGLTRMMSYFESRGGRWPTCTIFGLQYMLHRYLSKPITADLVKEAEALAHGMGMPFNTPGWMHIVNKHGGFLPVRIRSIPEGLIVPTQMPMITVESTDEEVPWVVSWLETPLVRVWEGSTIATTSREFKKIIVKYLEMTADDPEGKEAYAVHDFAGRGVTCKEQAMIATPAHLLSFFGSDTAEGVRAANHYYHCRMAATSIPATEHSTICLWGRQNEYAMFEDFVMKELVNRQVPAGVPKMAACVSDTYNVYEAVKAWTTGRLKQLVQSSGGTLVIRPDSGDFLKVVPEMLAIMEHNLGKEVKVNSKGFKVLPPYFRLIQGDGIDMWTAEDLLKKLVELGWSTENLAFGSGGGLLVIWDRDTQKWAFKACFGVVRGQSVDVRKDPVTDPGKRSKSGRLDLISTPSGFETFHLAPDQLFHRDSAMNTVFENGQILFDTNFDQIRARMALAS